MKTLDPYQVALIIEAFRRGQITLAEARGRLDAMEQVPICRRHEMTEKERLTS